MKYHEILRSFIPIMQNASMDDQYLNENTQEQRSSIQNKFVI